jgi:hypothetical protein
MFSYKKSFYMFLGALLFSFGTYEALLQVIPVYKFLSICGFVWLCLDRLYDASNGRS